MRQAIRTLIDNVGWKLLSVAIAVLLWASYSVESELGTSIAVPLQYRNLPQNLELSGDTGVDRFYLKVRGPAASLTPAALADSSVVLDVGAIDSSGEKTFTLGPGNVQLPSGVRLVRIVPSQVRLRFEQRTAKEVRVEPHFTSAPPPGYKIVSQEIIPDRIGIIGPESRVRSILSASTDPIDLSNTFGEAEFRVPVYLADPYIRLERDGPVVIRVRIEKNGQ